MSSRKRGIELSRQAKEDIRDILAYTPTTWGESQLAKYRAAINDALNVILKNPSAGRASVKPNLRVLPVEHHRIFYHTIDGTIYIVRILHERMDTSRNLEW
jgi:toxin ParE1/3/4